MKSRILRPTHPNAGVAAAYRRRLQTLVRALATSITAWVRLNYPAASPLAQDSAASDLQRDFELFVALWERRIDALAPELARYFTNRSAANADTLLAGAMREAGFTVRFQPTEAVQNALDAVLGENVALIRSIGSEHLGKVQAALQRSVAAGRDLGGMVKELRQIDGVTQRRAVLISRDQNNKATAVVNKTRMQELGITQAIWQHSHGGKHPRPSHQKADGKTFDLAKGMYLDGEWLQPGQAINCRCVCKPVVPALDGIL